MVMTIALDVLPITNLLNLVVDQVQQTMSAALDVRFEKRSFNELSTYLKCIHVILVNLLDRNLGEVPVVSAALKSLYQEVRNADDLIKKVKKYSPFLNIIYCRHTVKEFQGAVTAISSSFQALQLSCPEVAVDLLEGIEMVNDQLCRTNYTADRDHLEIMEEIDRGIRERRKDRQFANNIINSIGRSLGLSQESPQISRGLASLRKDKEDAALNKALQDDYYLGQVIALLSSADATVSLDESRLKYDQRKANYNNGPLGPCLKSFKCPLTNLIMRDPVTASNQKTYERKAIEEWFEQNKFTDPATPHKQLPDGNLRPNRALLESIDEWTERSNVARILYAKSKLQSGNEAEQKEACQDLSYLCEESSVYKDWIAFENLIPSMVKILQSTSEELKERSLHCLYTLVQSNETNKSRVVQAGGIGFAVKCLGRKPCVTKAALILLAEMVDNNLARENMESEPSFFLWVVTRRLTENDVELTRSADSLLDKLSDKDENIVEMLKSNWCDPFVSQLCQGTNDVKLKMASALSEMELRDDIKEELAKRGVVHALVTMLHSGDTHAKLASLKALQMLSSNSKIRHSMTEARAIGVLNDLFSNGELPVRLTEPAFAIIESLVCNHGIRFLVDTEGLPLKEEAVVKLLIGAFNTPTPAVNLHVLKCLSKLAQGSTSRNMRDLIRENLQAPSLISFLEHGKSEFRELTALLLFYLSTDEGDNEDDMRALLLNVHALEAFLGMLASNEVNVVESALDALERLTDLPDVEIKLQLARLDIFSSLKQTLTFTSSASAKVKAATILGNLSLSTASLSANYPVTGHFWPGSPSCKVHLGKCEAKTTLCIIKADLVPQLVALLSDRDSQVAEAGIDALFTLFSQDCQSRNAAQVLCDAHVMKPLTHLRNRTSCSCFEKAQKLFDQIGKTSKKGTWFPHFASTK